jgi:NAD(P)-dependent dehydrogenase (short-subunit alcohol dehydrogenase family)
VHWDITGRPVIVTGGNSGIGFATASALAVRGADVTITARSPDRGLEAANRIAADTGRRVGVGILDLADRASIRAFVDGFVGEHDELAVLVNNAGGVFGRRDTTTAGIERTFATNHLGPFELTAALTPLLVASAPARVINVASSGHGFASEGIPFDDLAFENGYSMRTAYGVSKLANILHAREFDARHGVDGVHAFAMHPGLVRTRIGRDGDSLLASIAWFATAWRQRTPEQGADTVVWLATTDPAPEPTGGYFEDRREARSTRWARSDEQATRLWEASEALLVPTDPAEDTR